MRHRSCSNVLLLILAAITLALPNSAWAQSSKLSSATTQVRDWKDVTGQHTIRASFVGVIDRSKVALKTDKGKEMIIELSQLSNADIYEAVKSDLMAKLKLAAPASTSPPRKKAQSAPRNKFQPSSRKVKGFSRRAKSSSGESQSTTALPLSKPKPTIDDGLVARIEEFIETVKSEDTETIFQTILHPSEYLAFSKSPKFKAGLEKFEKEKKTRLLTALQTIDLESIERKPGGRYQFQTDLSPINFKKVKGSWYLKN